MIRSLFIVSLALLLLAGAAAPAETSEPLGLETTASIASPPPACPLPEPELLSSRTASALRGTCTADCGPYADVTCSGSSCSSVDRNCIGGQRGSCWSNVEGTKYCPPCCTATATCSGGGQVTCTGDASCAATNSSCPSEAGSCWSDLEGTKNCAECGCSAETFCSGYGKIHCDGNNSCDFLKGCWVLCDSNYTFCPGQTLECEAN